MIQHRTVRPTLPSWSPGEQRRSAAAPGPAVATIPAPRQAPAGPLPAFGTALAGAPPAGLLSYLGPPVPEVRIRPRLLWVGLSWLLFAVLVLTGVAMFVAEAGADTGTGPDRFFAGGEVAKLELDPATDPLVYAALDGGGYVGCQAVGHGADSLLLTPTDTDWSVMASGREWHAAFHLAPAVAGTYQIRCEGAGTTFAVGEQTDVAASGGATLALLVLPLVGLATAVATTIPVLARRRAAQDRLFAAWTGGAAWPARQW